MDDTPRRVGDDMRGRAGEHDVEGRSEESARGYAGAGRNATSSTRDADEERSTGEIRSEIEQTREDISETIDAIQEKLRPGNIVSSATGRIKEATSEGARHMAQSVGSAAGSMMGNSRARSGGFVDTMRDNPLAAALIGVGAAWLFMNRRSAEDDREADRDRRARSYMYGTGREELSNFGGEYGIDYSRAGYRRTRGGLARFGDASEGSGIIDRVKNNPVPAALAGIGLGWLVFAGSKESEYDRDIRYGDRDLWERSHMGEESAMSQMKEKAADATSTVADSAQQMTTRAQEYAQDMSRRARRTGRRTQNELQRMTHDNPLAVGAGAFLLGTVVGLAIPESERENELLGETRDSVVDRAEEMARTATDRAQDAAADLVSDAASRIVSGTKE